MIEAFIQFIKENINHLIQLIFSLWNFLKQDLISAIAIIAVPLLLMMTLIAIVDDID